MLASHNCLAFPFTPASAISSGTSHIASVATFRGKASCSIILPGANGLVAATRPLKALATHHALCLFIPRGPMEIRHSSGPRDRGRAQNSWGLGVS
ncbi:hypothetical protein EJ04DRAFT_129752 [Polyplosphaeria fusca]|uniref:Uncharacterized protein n=1 Tax=Polyplosphaeria fusca TaxID=682080 RepID=A0A9P4R0W3_9PLEO|nr:hypothetical protein EJ04DRAFT_129752 [Polyplosphaeria fusca]